jgi:hypothetical protein
MNNNSQLMLPTSDQWAVWKADPISAWFFHAIERNFQEVTEGMVMGATLNTGSVDETALATTQAITEARVLYTIGRASYRDVCEMLDISIDEEKDEREDSTEGYTGVG